MPASIVIDIDPVVFSGGPITVYWYGVTLSLALLVGLAMAMREASLRGIEKEEVLLVAMWVVPAGLMGARLLHVVEGWRYYANYPLQIPAVQEGGLAMYGALAGGLVGGLAAARRGKIPFLPLLDTAAPATVLGQAIGQIGSFVNGEHQGAQTSLPWATSYVHPGNLAPDPLPRHPTQVYELLYDLVVFGVLILLRRHLRSDGLLFTIYLSLYAVGRLWISIFREDAPFLLGLQAAQLFSLATLLLAVPASMLLWQQWQRRKAPSPRR